MTGKQGFRRFRPKLVSLAVASCFVTSAVLANPTNPVFKPGAATITNPAANILHIQTHSPQTIINWGSFSISVGELTRFQQLSASSAVLNRVAAGNPSHILGALSSNGRVLLVNPSGIIFGAGAQIDVAGLVATSLNLTDADFLANRMRFAEVANAQPITNHGNITTPQGGNVYLVGPAVTNNGIITSPKGEVVLVAGNSVELVNPGTPNLRVEISAADNEARNIGTIIANAGRVGIYAGLINNSGKIDVNANQAVAKGGKILLQATKQIDLESTSILDASGAGGGTIEVLAKDSVKINGRLDASAPVKGDGGFIETSAAKVKFTPGTVVTTTAKSGKTGHYVLDPNDIFINVEGDITGDDIEAAVLANNFTLTTADAYGGPGVGNITVDDTISLNSNNSLTLVAHSDIFVNQSITNAKTGGINLYAGWDGTSSKTAPVVVPRPFSDPLAGDISVVAPISTLGDVKLIAGGHASQAYGGTITANGLRIDSLGTNANFQLNNSVNTLSGQAVIGFLFSNNKTFSVGTTGDLSGITVSSGGGGGVNLGFSGTTGATNLNVNSNITAIAASGNRGNIQLVGNSSYGGNVNISNAILTATGDGGEGGTISATAFTGGAVNIANSTLKANSTGTGCCSSSSNINISGSTVSITGNSTLEAVGSSGGASNSGGQGEVFVNADSSVTITGSTLRGQGGDGVDGAQGQVGVSSDGGTLTIQGGSVIEALGGKGSTGEGGWASVNINSSISPQTININNSTVRAKAGSGSTKGVASVGIFDNTGNINITNGSSIEADGAEGRINVFADVGNVTISNSAFTAKGNAGGGESFVDVEGSKLSISSSSFTINHATNAPNDPGFATSNLHASGPEGLSMSGSTVDLSATGTVPGFAGTEISSAGNNVTISNSTIKASGLEAGVLIGSSGSLAVTNSTISATGKTGAQGGVGIAVLLTETGAIDTSGSAISATGRTAAEGGMFQQDTDGFPIPAIPGSVAAVTTLGGGDITLGFVSSNDQVIVASSNGKILDGNVGGNVSAPLALLMGANGVGSLADPLETVVGTLAVAADGGEIGILNSGNLVLSQLVNGGSGASAIGTTGTMHVPPPFEEQPPITVSGDLILLANNGMVIQQNISSGGNLVLDSGIGDLGFDGVSVHGNNVTLGGNNILVGFTTSTAPTDVRANGLMKVTTLRNLNVLGGANSGASATLHGLDVDLTVGLLAGFVNVVEGSGGPGAYAQISAGSPDTINLFFPTLSAGGFFVNGVEGAISSGNTGFFANGLPAVLGENFFVTYGAAELPPDVQLAINQTIASTNQQSQLGTDVGNESGGTGDPNEEKEKKQLPVCGK